MPARGNGPATRAYRPSRGSLGAALAAGVLTAAFLWPRTRAAETWTSYSPGPPSQALHLGPPFHWENMVGLTTSYAIALLAGAALAGAVIAMSMIHKAPRARGSKAPGRTGQ